MSDTPRFRMLPASDIAERGVVCSFLLAPKEVGGMCAERGVSAGWFHNPALGTLFTVLLALWVAESKIDNVILTQTLANQGLLDQVGGAATIAELFTYLPTATNIGYYLDILHEKHTLRGVITVCTEFAGRAYEEQEDVPGIVNELSKAVAEVAGGGQKHDTKTFKELLFEKMNRMQEGEEQANIIRTGLAKLDEISPLHYGDMPMIAGERKAGKSIFALTLAMNIAEKAPVLYFSLEDRAAQVIDRIFAGATHIPIVRQNAASLNEGDYRRISREMETLSARIVQIRDDVFDLAAIVAVMRQQKAKWPDLAAVFVDYLQLVRTAKEKGQSREQEVALVSRTLRLIGMELGVAVVVLSQVNEDGKSRESRGIENDVTAAWMVCKPEDEKEWNSKRIIAIPFQRNGEMGMGFPVTFHGHFARMENFAEDTL